MGVKANLPLSQALSALDDRCALRENVAMPATLRLGGGRSFQTTVWDISIAGFSATALTRLPVDSLVWLTLPGLESLPARVAWWADSRVGCGFVNLLNPIVLDHAVSRWKGI